MAEPLSVSEFSSKVKSKYPEYASVDDATLAQKIVEKYPEYADKVKLDTSVSPKAATEKKVAEPKEAPKEPSPVAPSKKPDVVESVSSPTPKTSDIVKGVGTEIGIGVSGQVAGTAIGTAIMPGVGTAIGYGVGSIGSGIAGSIAAQRIEGQEDISWGRAIAAGLINLVPGGAAKGAKGAAKITTGMVGRAAAKESAKGVAFGATEATSRAIIDEGRLPTKEELATYAGAGALFGGALGAVTPKVSKSMDKFLGRSAAEIDDALIKGDLTYKDFKPILDQDARMASKSPPPVPETRGRGQQFHGTSGEIGKSGMMSDSYSSDNIYGQGFYTTDAMDIAKGYTKKGLGENAAIYSISEKSPVNFLDIDGVSARRLAIDADVVSMPEVQDALDDLPKGATGTDLYNWIRRNTDLPKDEIQEVFQSIQDGIAKRGFGGIKHVGGKLTKQNPHTVKIYFDPKNQIDVSESMRFDVPELTQLKRAEVKNRKARSELPFNNKEAFEKWASERKAIQDRIAELEKPRPSMEGIFRGNVAQMQSRARSKVAAEALTSPAPITTMKNKMWSILAPSRVVGKEARNEALNFRKRVASAEELGGRIERRVAKEIRKDPTVEGRVNAFLDGGEVDPSLGSLNDELIVYRSKMNELQGELIHQLELDHMASMKTGELREVTDKILKLREEAQSMSGKKLKRAEKKLTKMQKKVDATPQLIEKIKKSKELNKYARQEYRMFTDSEFVPDIKLRAKAQEELVTKIMAKNKNMTRPAAEVKASKHLDDLENKSARVRKAEARQGSGRALYEAPLKQKKNVGDAEKAWLGEITETGEKMRGTLSGVARLVARKQTDRNVAAILSKHGLAVPANKQSPNMVELRLKSGETTGLHVAPEVQASVNRLYLDGAQMRSSNPIIAGIQDLYSSSVGLSKATKVLLNPPSYFVQIYGNTMNLLGMGVNPFGGAGKGIRLALSEYGGLEYLMSKAGRTERVAFLKELNDMAKYGIKGENIMESDIRDAFERGLFSKMTDKPVGFFGKAYSVPDTVGRYVGWKAQQKMLRKVYPHLGDEDIKRLGAEVINDTYQNYDRLSGTIKSLSRMGVMPQFASFTAEFMRNQYNQAKIIKQMLGGTFGADLGIDVSKANVKAMRVEGAKRLAALSTVYGATAGTISAINRDGGISEGDEEHIRELVPNWDKHKSLAMRLSDDGKKMSYANVSYIAPQALGLAAFDAGMSGEPIENLSGMLVEELVGDGSFVNREMMAAINNRNDRGQKISSEENDLKNAMDRLEYFVKQTFKPGAAREVKKMDEALRGVGDLTTKQVLARQVGYRVNTIDFAENAKYLIMEHKDNADMSKRKYTKARDKGTMRPEDLEALYQSANESRKKSMAQIARRNENLINRGYTEEERIQVLKNGGVGGKDILSILNGTYKDIPRVSLPSTSDSYNELTGSMSEKRTQIRDIMKGDRDLGTKLMRKWEQERRAERSGVTNKDSLIRGLDTFEKVEYIRSQPNPSSLLMDLRRKRLVSDEVVRAVRLAEGR